MSRRESARSWSKVVMLGITTALTPLVMLSSNFSCGNDPLADVPAGLNSSTEQATAGVRAQPAANLDQLRNGASNAPVNPPNWVNGNVGAQTGHYIEGYSIAYRAVLTDLPLNTSISLVLGYDIKHSGKHAIDYLTHYNRINNPAHSLVFNHAVEPINPLDGVSGVGGLTTTFAIPAPGNNISVDPDGAGPDPAALQPLTSFNSLANEDQGGGTADQRFMTLFGGTITNIQYCTGTTNGCGLAAEGDLSASQSEARVRVTFTASSATAVLAWGGHIGSRSDWGLPNDPQSAGGVSGSPYHMRLKDWTLNNLGNQDRSLSAAAVFVPCGTCNVVGLDPVCQGTTNQYCAEIAGICNSPVYSWNVSGACHIVGSSTGSCISVMADAAGSCTVNSSITCAGCSGSPLTCSKTIAINPSTAADAGDDGRLCQPASGQTCFNLSGTGAGGPPSWSIINRSTNPADCEITITGGDTLTPSVCFAEGCTGSATLRLTISGTAPCPDATDDTVLVVVPRPTADAGQDQSRCEESSGETCFDLNGSGSNGTPLWSILSRSTTPSDCQITITGGATYTPTVCFAEGCTGTATLKLTVTGASPCTAADDDTVLLVVGRPRANAGDDGTLCEAEAGSTCFGLSGSGANGTPSWSISNRSTSPADCEIIITDGDTYNPTICFAEGCTGSATLRLTVTGSPPCDDAFDDVVLRIRPRPTADAGQNQSKCEEPVGETCFDLNGSGSNGTPSWSILSRSTTPSDCEITIIDGDTYTPAVCFAEGCTGTATLKLTVTGTPPCTEASDDTIVLIVGRPRSDAGDNQTLCEAEDGATCFDLSGSGQNGTPSWSIIDRSTLPADCDITIDGGDTFSPTVCFAEGCSGTAILQLTVTGDPLCDSATDDVALTVVARPRADAGDDQFACEEPVGETCLDLNGSGSNGTPSWSILDRSTTPADCEITIIGGNTYGPTVCFAEGCTGTATLKLTVTGRSPCTDATDDTIVLVVGRPRSDAGDDDTLCEADDGATCFPLSGNATNGTCSWSVISEPSLGCVTIADPDNCSTTACFAEGCTGSATLRLTVTGSPLCDSATDDVDLTVVPRPRADAGEDLSKCEEPIGPTCLDVNGSGSNGTPSWSILSRSTTPSDCDIIITGGDTYTPTVCFAEGCTGTATLKLTVTGTPPCTEATDDTVLLIVGRPRSDAGDDDTKCEATDGSTCFDLSGSATNGTCSWSVISEPSLGCVTIGDPGSCSTTACFAEGCTGSATLRLTVTGDPLCDSATDDVVLTANENPTCEIFPPQEQPLCRSTNNLLSATASGGLGPYTLGWSVDSPAAPNDWIITSATDGLDITYTPHGPGPATFHLKVTDSEGCEHTCSQTLDCLSVPVGCTIDPPVQNVACCGSATFCASPSGIAPFSVDWYDPSGNLIAGASCPAVPAGGSCCLTISSAQPSQAGIYTARFTDSGDPSASSECTAILEVGACGNGCTPGYWKNHTQFWDGVGTNDVTTTVQTTDLFNATFGVTPAQSGISNNRTLLQAVNLMGGGVLALDRHAAAALVSAEALGNYPFTLAEVIALYRDAVDADPGPETIASALAKLEAANQLNCPCNDVGCP